MGDRDPAGAAPAWPRLPSVGEVNAARPDALAGLLAPLFEDAAPLATALAARRPFGTWEEVLDAAEAVVAALPAGEQVRLLRAHPRIGEDPAVLRRRSALSHAEQGGAAASQAQDVDARLATLNAAYEARHGFPFVVFVAGRPRAELVDVLTERLGRPPEEELATALAAVLAIARDRLATLRSRGTGG